MKYRSPKTGIGLVLIVLVTFISIGGFWFEKLREDVPVLTPEEGEMMSPASVPDIPNTPVRINVGDSHYILVTHHSLTNSYAGTLQANDGSGTTNVVLVNNPSAGTTDIYHKPDSGDSVLVGTLSSTSFNKNTEIPEDNAAANTLANNVVSYYGGSDDSATFASTTYANTGTLNGLQYSAPPASISMPQTDKWGNVVGGRYEVAGSYYYVSRNSQGQVVVQEQDAQGQSTAAPPIKHATADAISSNDGNAVIRGIAQLSTQRMQEYYAILQNTPNAVPVTVSGQTAFVIPEPGGKFSVHTLSGTTHDVELNNQNQLVYKGKTALVSVGTTDTTGTIVRTTIALNQDQVAALKGASPATAGNLAVNNEVMDQTVNYPLGSYIRFEGDDDDLIYIVTDPNGVMGTTTQIRALVTAQGSSVARVYTEPEASAAIPAFETYTTLSTGAVNSIYQDYAVEIDTSAWSTAIDYRWNPNLNNGAGGVELVSPLRINYF